MERTAAVVSLGCSKNLVDSETMVAQLTHLGYVMVDDPQLASLILLNTCGFLESAVEEAIETALQLASHKETGACSLLILAGCMVQRYGKKLVSLMPEVDLFVGTSHFHQLTNILAQHELRNRRKIWISRPKHLIDSNTPRLVSTSPYSAYIKIAEGCSNTCSFCLIPRLRGSLRSRTVEDIRIEASRFAAEGVKEINLIAQDTTAFGCDLGEKDAIIKLLHVLEEVEKIEWIRILYAYPDRINEELLRLIARSSKIVPYLDIPIQHCVPKILRFMRRQNPDSGTSELISKIRSFIPDIALRTSLMVGFPGETDDDFFELLEFVHKTEFDHAGVFSFSPEPGSRAAKLPNQVSDEVKEQRRNTLLAAQQDVSKRLLEKKIGKIAPVLIEGAHPETELLLAGRLPTQAPEVDGEVLITRGTCNPGEIRLAKITNSYDYDLAAELLEE